MVDHEWGLRHRGRRRRARGRRPAAREEGGTSFVAPFLMVERRAPTGLACNWLKEMLIMAQQLHAPGRLRRWWVCSWPLLHQPHLQRSSGKAHCMLSLRIGACVGETKLEGRGCSSTLRYAQTHPSWSCKSRQRPLQQGRPHAKEGNDNSRWQNLGRFCHGMICDCHCS